MRIAKIVAFSCIAVCFAAGAYAQDYPTKPVRVIVPFTAGSATDLLARAVSQKLSELWGQLLSARHCDVSQDCVGPGDSRRKADY